MTPSSITNANYNTEGKNGQGAKNNFFFQSLNGFCAFSHSTETRIEKTLKVLLSHTMEEKRFSSRLFNPWPTYNYSCTGRETSRFRLLKAD